MSTLKVNTVQHNTSGFNNVVQFTDGAGTQNGTLCRAWVNFNGTGTVAIRASFNVSSITDNGQGDYSTNFSNSMSDANYCATVSHGETTGTLNGGYASWRVQSKVLTHLQAGSVRITPVNDNGSTLQDLGTLCIAIFR